MMADGRPSAKAVICRQCHIGAKVVSHGRYVAFQMVEVAIPRQMFQEILRLLEVTVAVRTSRLSCRKTGKTRIFSPVHESSGESWLTSWVSLRLGRPSRCRGIIRQEWRKSSNPRQAARCSVNYNSRCLQGRHLADVGLLRKSICGSVAKCILTASGQPIAVALSDRGRVTCSVSCENAADALSRLLPASRCCLGLAGAGRGAVARSRGLCRGNLEAGDANHWADVASDQLEKTDGKSRYHHSGVAQGSVGC